VLGVDLDEAHLQRARARSARFGDRAAFERGDAVELDLGGRRFDLVMCRHMLQAVPHAERVLAHMARATRPGGRLHVVAEDYGMMHFHPTRHDIDEFWREGPVRFAAALGTDLLNGRKVFSMLRALGLGDVRVDYVVVDTTRVPRELFARIWTAWRDGYVDAVALHSGLPRAHVDACFEDMIRCIRDPDGYAVWQLPVITGVVPA
jgi:SAM-dependent methyltransferase